MITRTAYLVTLTTKAPIRIGGKADPLSEAENPVTVVGGRVCLPGPSLKGALRAEVETYLHDSIYDEKEKRWPEAKTASRPCIPGTSYSQDEQRLIREGHFRDRACHYPCDTGQRGKCGTSNHSICPACYLFGAQGLVGFVSVPFLFTDVRYDELYSARLERTSHTVMHGTNRSYQLIPPDTKFSGKLEVLAEDTMVGWKLGEPRELKQASKGDEWLRNHHWSSDKIVRELLVERLAAISSIGGYRSKGFGGVEMKVRQLDSQSRGSSI